MRGIFEGVIGGTIAGAAILSAYLLVTANANGANGGDWLAFAGVFFGVGATIVGTLSIDWVKRGRQDRAVRAALRKALDDWVVTVDSYENGPASSIIADLEQQRAYIATIAPEVGRDAVHLKLGLHAFEYHVPAMLNALRTQAASMVPVPPEERKRVLNDLRGYAVAIGGALPSS